MAWQVFACIRDRNDATRVEMDQSVLLERIHEFLTA